RPAGRAGSADGEGGGVMQHVFPPTGAAPGLDPGAAPRGRLGPVAAPGPAHGSGSVVKEYSQQPIGSIAPSPLRGSVHFGLLAQFIPHTGLPSGVTRGPLSTRKKLGF